MAFVVGAGVVWLVLFAVLQWAMGSSLRPFLDRLPARRLVVPGNHDVPLYNVLHRFFTRRRLLPSTAFHAVPLPILRWGGQMSPPPSIFLPIADGEGDHAQHGGGESGGSTNAPKCDEIPVDK